MAGISRVNGFGNYVVGSYRSSANIGAYLVTVKNASASAQDIRAEDDAANEVVEAIMMATNAIGSSFTSTPGLIATGFTVSVLKPDILKFPPLSTLTASNILVTVLKKFGFLMPPPSSF